MSVKEKITLRRIFQFIIALVALISSVLGIYTFFFQDKTREISFEILANTSVLDINADVTKLDITYDNKSLKSNNQSLRIINLRVRNTGNECILKEFYDTDDPLGLFVTKGTIIEKPELVSTSNDYIKQKLITKFDSNERLTFNNIILEPNEFYTVKLLILHKTNHAPELHAFGKIAGIKKMEITSLIQEAKTEKSFWEITFGGGIFTQILRWATYSLAFILVLVAFLITTEELSNTKKKIKRVQALKDFKNQSSYDYNRMDDAIFSRFEKDGHEVLLRYNFLLRDENRLNQKYNNWINKLKRNVEDEVKETDINSSPFRLNDTFFTRRSEWTVINEMIGDGYAIKDKDKLIINQPMKKTLGLFIDYLKEIKYYKPSEMARSIPTVVTDQKI